MGLVAQVAAKMLDLHRVKLWLSFYTCILLSLLYGLSFTGIMRMVRMIIVIVGLETVRSLLPVLGQRPYF